MTRTKTAKRQRMCGQKVAYSSQMVADNAATALGWTGREGLHGYLCPYCTDYHIGRDHYPLTTGDSTP